MENIKTRMFTFTYQGKLFAVKKQEKSSLKMCEAPAYHHHHSDLNTLMRKMNEIVQSHDIFSNLLPNRIHAKLVKLMVKAGLKEY